MLADVAVVSNDGFSTWQDSFQGGSLGSAWTAASWVSDGAPAILPSNVSSASANEDVGAVSAALTLDTSQTYQIDLYIAPYGTSYGGTYKIYALMGAGLDVTADGVEAEITMTGGDGTWTAQAVVYNGGTPTTHTATAGVTDLGYDPPGFLSLLVDESTPNIKMYWRGTQILNQNITLGGSAGSRFGFGLECTVAGSFCLADLFRVQYYTTDKVEKTRNKLMASSNGLLYKETFVGTMAQVSTSLTLNSSEMLMATDRGQKLYIADFGGPIIDNSASVSGPTLTVSGVTTGNCDKDDFVAVISNPTGPTAGTYTLSAVGSGSVTLSSSPGDGPCAARLERAPKVYDPAADTLAILTATAGQVPTGAQIVCLYRDRLCFAKDHVIYQSRVGTMTDFDYAAASTDATRAVSSTASDSDTGQIGELITALAPFSDDYLVIGCEHSLWIQRGDLAFGGSIDNVTRGIGIVDRNAWTWGPSGELVFMTHNGIYAMSSARAEPQMVSRDIIPDDLRDIDLDVYSVHMQWDSRGHGIHIFLTPSTYTSRLHYWFDWKNKGLWPVLLPANYEPTVIGFHNSLSSQNRGVMLGCRDGYIRHFHENYETDQGTTIDDYILLGPFRIWDDYSKGVLNEIVAVIAKDSGNVTWTVYKAETHEDVVTASAFKTGTFTSGLQYRVRPKAGGGSAMIRLEGATANRSWELERLHIVVRSGGEQRNY
jgi:hypothetical protein